MPMDDRVASLRKIAESVVEGLGPLSKIEFGFNRQSVWCVAIGANTAAYPFGKVQNQLESGLEGGESIISFYDVFVDHVVTGAISSAINKDS